MAYMALYRFNRDPKWLNFAKSAADWTKTFRWIYNIRFPDYRIMTQYRFCSRGADNASPANNHLHNYVLVCLTELLAIYKETKDEYYAERMLDLFPAVHR